MILVPTLSPGLLLRASDDAGGGGAGKFQDAVLSDVLKARRLTRQLPVWDESQIWERDAGGRPWRLFPNAEEVAAFVQLAAANAAQGGTLVADVETSGDHPMASKLLCVGLGLVDRAGRVTQLFCVPFLARYGSAYWSPFDAARVRAALAWLFAFAPMCFHNGAFDTTVLACHGMPVGRWTSDTMQAHHIADGEMPMNLAYCASRKTDGRYWKDDVKGDTAWVDMDPLTLRSYNLRDILSTGLCLTALETDVRKLGAWDLYQDELRLCRYFTRATWRGLAVDESRRAALAVKLRAQRDGGLALMRQVAGSNSFDPGKPTHLTAFLYDLLKFPVVKTTKTGKAATDKDAIVLLALYADTPQRVAALQGLIDFKSATKTLSTWVENLPILGDGRIHPSWKLLPVTGRFASAMNVQNLPLAIKKILMAAQPGTADPRGEKYTGVDLSQAELRYIGYDADDPYLLRMYELGVNVHTVNAALFFGVRPPLHDKKKVTEPHKDLDPVTIDFMKTELPRLTQGQMTYESLIECPEAKHKPTRTLAKNGEFGCARFDTLVAMLSGGGKRICAVRPGDWTWCWDGEKYAPTRVVRTWTTGVKSCVRITMTESGVRKPKTIILTACHKMVLRDGTKKPAGDLKPGDRLMPFRRWCGNSQGYSSIDPFNDGRRYAEHRWVLPGYETVHHVNENTTDNRPENLEGTTASEHAKHHWDAERYEQMAQAAKEQWASEGKENVVARLTAARVASPKWHASTKGRLKKMGATNRKNGEARRALWAPCACGAQAFAKGKCKKCYARDYMTANAYKYRKTKPQNHRVVSIEPCGEHEVWDLEVEHEAHNFAVEGSVFISNSNYGGMDETLFKVLRAKRDPDTNELLFPDIQLAEVSAILAVKKRIRPALVDWQHRVPLAAQAQGFHRCPISGRYRFFRGGFKLTEVTNTRIQMGVASHMNKRTLEIIDVLDRETGGAAQIVNQVHDALTVEGPTEYAQRAGEVMVEILSRPFSLPKYPNARLPADKADIGQYLNEV